MPRRESRAVNRSTSKLEVKGKSEFEEAKTVVDENVPEIVRRGVSLGFLLRYAAFVKNHLRQAEYKEMKTQDLVHGIGVDPLGDSPEKPADYSIRGLSQDFGLNFVEFMQSNQQTVRAFVEDLEKQDIPVPKEVLDQTLTSKQSWFGPADFFVSHSWKLELGQLLEALQDPRCTNSDTIEDHYRKYFWIDIFAVNQHYKLEQGLQSKVEKKRKEDLESFDSVIEMATEGVILFLYPWNKPSENILARAWCWYEISLAIKHNRKMYLAMTKDDAKMLKAVSNVYLEKEENRTLEQKEMVEQIETMFEGIDVTKSECRLSKDKAYILERIRKDPGTKEANGKIIVQIATLLMHTADTMLSTQQITGADTLYEAMLKFLPEEEKAPHQNNLIRLYHLMGWENRAETLCESAIEAQERHLLTTNEPSRRGALLKSLAANLSSKGRLYGDQKSPDALGRALPLFDRALGILEDLNDDSESRAEVLYNSGRSIVLHYELFGATPSRKRNRTEDLEKAHQYLDESKRIQEAGVKNPGALGACNVFLARVLELLGKKDKTEISSLFERGIDIQEGVFGKSDARVFMSKTDYGRFCLQIGEFDRAYDLLFDAYNGLSEAVKRDNNPVKLLECLEVFLELCYEDERKSEDAKKLERTFLNLLDWMEENKPHILDSKNIIGLVVQLQALIFTKTPKFDVVLEFMATDEEERFARNKRQSVKRRAQTEVKRCRMRHSEIKGQIPEGLCAPGLLCMKMEEMLTNMPSLIADVIVCDAPYNIGIDQTWDKHGHECFVQKINGWARLMVKSLAPDGIGFAFTDSYYLSYWINALRTARGAPALNEVSSSPAPTVIVETLVWYKPDAAWRKDWVEQNRDRLNAGQEFSEQPQVVKQSFEMILIFRRSKSAGVEFLDIANTLAPDAANVVSINKCSGSERLGGKYFHPAQKPLALMEPLVRICKMKSGRSNDELLVLEPFCGTASALAAASLLGIPSIGCDYDEKWVEAATDRMSHLTLKDLPARSRRPTMLKSFKEKLAKTMSKKK